MKITDKKKVVEDLHDRFSRSKVVIVTDYKGLDVTTISELRTKLREAGVEYKVVKNTLLIRASADTGVAPLQDYFKGPSGIALSYDDPVAPAKVLVDFAKDHKHLDIKIGIMDEKILDIDRIKSLAELPSREVLLAQVLAAMNGVPAGFVRTLSAIPSQLLNVLQAIIEQKEAA